MSRNSNIVYVKMLFQRTSIFYEQLLNFHDGSCRRRRGRRDANRRPLVVGSFVGEIGVIDKA